MAGQASSAGLRSGPGNKTIATTLLEWLAVRGRMVARDRAARVLAEGEIELATAPAWLADDAIDAMFAAGEVDVSLARAIGHRLVAPDATGLRLYGLGLATPEKAYRRVQSLLPREAREARWSVEAIEGRSARLRFEASPDEVLANEATPNEASPNKQQSASAGRRSEAALCALRTGMLEAIPGLFGLLPAEVHESSCRAEGSDACCYAVRWQTTSRSGAVGGLAIGGVIGAGFAMAWVGLGAAPLFGAGAVGATAIAIAALSALVLGGAVGRVVDVQRQLEAVAGARRGHLALFDQVDDALAAKLDALARADAKLEGESSISPVRRPTSGSAEAEGGVSPESQRGILTAARQIHRVAGDLECWFEAAPVPDDPVGDSRRGVRISEERGRVREIREWAARIGKLAAFDGEGVRVRVELRALVGRAIATARPSLPPASIVRLDSVPDLRTIECDPIQIEQLVVQLVQNAVEASIDLSQAPEVFVGLTNATRGVELAVEDRGVGLESTEIDEVFDPFFGDRAGAEGGGLGLKFCLRIIEGHGGELRIETENRAGTRVSVWLPEAAEVKTR